MMQAPCEKLKAYVDRHRPFRLRRRAPLLYKLLRNFGAHKIKLVRGKENIPIGPVVFIVNHDGGETPKLIAAVDRPVHVVSAQSTNWKRPLMAFFMRRLGMVPIQETLSHLSRLDIEKLSSSKSRYIRSKHYNEVWQRRVKGNAEKIRCMCSLLILGRSIAIFPQGLIENITARADIRRAYAGYALVAREYKKLTGRDIPIVPVAIYRASVVFGKPLLIDAFYRNSTLDLEEMATNAIATLLDSLDTSKSSKTTSMADQW
jgi:1-acyl-sn-glycerol-3-phosphate acyltransferase